MKLKHFFEAYKLTWSKHTLETYSPYYPKENLLPEKNDYNICNIEVLQPVEYGRHYKILKKMDIGLGFSPNKKTNLSVGSSKLFDYMCCKLKIVCEDGCHNTPYIEKYNFGKVISRISNINEMIKAIQEVTNMSKKDILYDKFINEHNHIRRAEKLVKNVYRIVDEFKIKDKLLITDEKQKFSDQEIAEQLLITDKNQKFSDQEIAEQLLMSMEDVNYISNSH